MAALRSRGRIGVAGPCEATGCPAVCRPGVWSMPPGNSARNCSVCCRTLGPSHLPGIAPCSRLVEVRGGVHRTLVAERSASRNPRPATRAESIPTTGSDRHFLRPRPCVARQLKAAGHTPPPWPPGAISKCEAIFLAASANSGRTPKGGASGACAGPRKCSQARD